MKMSTATALKYIVEAIESNAAEEAHRLGLEYVGWGKWRNKQGQVVARTMDGKLEFFDAAKHKSMSDFLKGDPNTPSSSQSSMSKPPPSPTTSSPDSSLSPRSDSTSPMVISDEGTVIYGHGSSRDDSPVYSMHNLMLKFYRDSKIHGQKKLGYTYLEYEDNHELADREESGQSNLLRRTLFRPDRLEDVQHFEDIRKVSKVLGDWARSRGLMDYLDPNGQTKRTYNNTIINEMAQRESPVMYKEDPYVPVTRSMSIKNSELEEFLKLFQSSNPITLPPSGFSLVSEETVGFSLPLSSEELGHSFSHLPNQIQNKYMEHIKEPSSTVILNVLPSDKQTGKLSGLSIPAYSQAARHVRGVMSDRDISSIDAFKQESEFIRPGNALMSVTKIRKYIVKSAPHPNSGDSRYERTVYVIDAVDGGYTDDPSQISETKNTPRRNEFSHTHKSHSANLLSKYINGPLGVVNIFI